MRRIAVILGFLGSLIFVSDATMAQDCIQDVFGRVICSERIGPRPYYRERNHDDDPRYYRRRDSDEPRDYRYSRDPNVGCPRGYTRQDGVCKPYTGR